MEFAVGLPERLKFSLKSGGIRIKRGRTGRFSVPIVGVFPIGSKCDFGFGNAE
jgi:hypothetical protein